MGQHITRVCAVAASLWLTACGLCPPFSAQGGGDVLCRPVGPCDNVRCDVCLEPLTVNIVDDATGAPISGATATGAQCTPDGRCVFDNGAGEYTFTVSAPGYVSSEHRVVVMATPDSCCCPYIEKTVEVRLVRE